MDYGTDGLVRDAATWRLLEGHVPSFGITRIADITGLDVIGVHTAAAIVPDSHILTVFQGKGVSFCSARIGATLEAAEAWHVQRRTPPACYVAPASDTEVGYDLSSLPDQNLDAITDAAPMEWIAADPLVQASSAKGPVLVPRSLVDMSPEAIEDPFRPYIATSNGLGAGLDEDHATMHALLEVIERDATSALTERHIDERVYLDLDSVTEPPCADILQRLRAMSVWVEVVLLPGRAGITVVVAYLWSPEMPVITAGSAAAIDPAAAIFRALSEAAQSRLTAISGSRDDIPPGAYNSSANAAPRCPKRPATRKLDDVDGLGTGEVGDHLAMVCRELARDGLVPLKVSLGSGAVSVVKVIVPGLRHERGHRLSRRVT